MRRFVLLILLLAGCATPEQPAPTLSLDTLPPDLVALTPYFVESDLELAWTYARPLAEHEFFAVRVWADGADEQREVWTQETTLNAAEMIDSYSRAVGAFHWDVVVVGTDAAGNYQRSISLRSDAQTLQRVRRLPLDPLPEAEWSDLARIVHDAGDSATDWIDAAHQFVVDHASIDPRVQQNSSAYLPDYSDAAQMLVAHATGEGDAPGLFCDGLSTVMLTTLQQLGMESRLVFLYSDLNDSSYIVQHTMIEIFNPDTQGWELHDPTSNTIFVDAEGQRAAAERVVYGDWDALQVCGLDSPCMPLADAGPETFVVYLEAMRYGGETIYRANPQRFNVANLFAHYDNPDTSHLLPADPRSYSFRFGLDL